MADYMIISDVSEYILNSLREKMCPVPIPSPQGIAIAAPDEQNSDYILGLYLYEVKQDGEISTPKMMPSGQARFTKPPKPYCLNYMIYVNGSSQMGLKAVDVQKIIGKAAQVMGDESGISSNSLQPWLEVSEPQISLSPNKITFEEKTSIWRAINKPYQLSLFYKASPIFISSEVMTKIPPVVDGEFQIWSLREERGGG